MRNGMPLWRFLVHKANEPWYIPYGDLLHIQFHPRTKSFCSMVRWGNHFQDCRTLYWGHLEMQWGKQVGCYHVIDAWIHHGAWCSGSMTTGKNKTSFPREVHLHVKHDVTSDFLETNKVRHFTFSCLLWCIAIVSLLCNLNFGHFLFTAFLHRSMFVTLLISNASLTVLGKQILNLWVIFQYCDFTFDMIWFLWQRICGARHLNAGSLISLFAMAHTQQL
jgi:hypothetical protein